MRSRPDLPLPRCSATGRKPFRSRSRRGYRWADLASRRRSPRRLPSSSPRAITSPASRSTSMAASTCEGVRGIAMAAVNRRRDYLELPESYRRFWNEAARFIPKANLACDPFRTLAFGTDASFYRLIPKIVVQVRTREELSSLLGCAGRLRSPVTFRAAGTSLSGQAGSDSVLLVLAGGWRGHRVHDRGERISLEPGLIGGEANALLAPYRRKIGPDPASINSCMIGGIAANNASGMCCGTALNSYQTVESMRVILWDGSLLDTADAESRNRFAQRHPGLVDGLAAIRDEIAADEQLAERICEKHRVKSTTDRERTR